MWIFLFVCEKNNPHPAYNFHAYQNILLRPHVYTYVSVCTTVSEGSSSHSIVDIAVPLISL